MNHVTAWNHLKRAGYKRKPDVWISHNAAFEGIKCVEELCKIMEYIDSLQYQDRVDYDYIYKLVKL
ncbi:hypothetical protein ANCDUO_10254, partial [Ancylostoma duodenale]